MSAVKVKVRQLNGRYQLVVNDQPFYIKGAGLEWGDIKSLADFGGNTFRTWRVDNGKQSALEILDRAQQYGLMVCMGLDVARERHGFDYNDAQAVAQQKAWIEKDVRALKNHPALLMWGIGNELNLRHQNAKVWDAVEDIAQMIHHLDPDHPVTTMLAGAEPTVIETVVARCPSLDLLSFQLYGEIDQLPHFLSESRYAGAYTVSEWGATGHWEVESTEWNRPIEPNSSEKARDYSRRYRDYIQADSHQCLGAFVFLWGQKQERTPTWYGVFLESGEVSESAQMMQTLWTGIPPAHPVPQIRQLTINGLTAYDHVRLSEGDVAHAAVEVSHQDESTLRYYWEIMHEVDSELESDGGDFEPTPDVVWHASAQRNGHRIEFTAPAAGEYRLFVYVLDAHGGAANANLPILAKPLSLNEWLKKKKQANTKKWSRQKKNHLDAVA